MLIKFFEAGVLRILCSLFSHGFGVVTAFKSLSPRFSESCHVLDLRERRQCKIRWTVYIAIMFGWYLFNFVCVIKLGFEPQKCKGSVQGILPTATEKIEDRVELLQHNIMRSKVHEVLFIWAD